VAWYSGDAGDAIAAAKIPDWYANGMMFSTPDSDNDRCSCNCAVVMGLNSGWWYNWCSTNLLNMDAYGLWTTGNPAWNTNVQASRMLVKLN